MCGGLKQLWVSRQKVVYRYESQWFRRSRDMIAAADWAHPSAWSQQRGAGPSPARTSAVQGDTRALSNLLQNSKLSSSDCKTNSTSRNTIRRLFCMLRFAPVSSLQMTWAAVVMLTGRETTGGHLPAEVRRHSEHINHATTANNVT